MNSPTKTAIVTRLQNAINRLKNIDSPSLVEQELAEEFEVVLAHLKDIVAKDGD